MKKQKEIKKEEDGYRDQSGKEEEEVDSLKGEKERKK